MTIASRPSTTPIAPKRMAPVVELADLVELDPEAVGDEADLRPELAGDRARQVDPGLEVQGLPEPQGVDHDLLDAVVVVQGDLIAVDLGDRPARGGERQRD